MSMDPTLSGFNSDLNAIKRNIEEYTRRSSDALSMSQIRKKINAVASRHLSLDNVKVFEQDLLEVISLANTAREQKHSNDSKIWKLFACCFNSKSEVAWNKSIDEIKDRLTNLASINIRMPVNQKRCVAAIRQLVKESNKIVKKPEFKSFQSKYLDEKKKSIFAIEERVENLERLAQKYAAINDLEEIEKIEHTLLSLLSEMANLQAEIENLTQVVELNALILEVDRMIQRADVMRVDRSSIGTALAEAKKFKDNLLKELDEKGVSYDFTSLCGSIASKLSAINQDLPDIKNKVLIAENKEKECEKIVYENLNKISDRLEELDSNKRGVTEAQDLIEEETTWILAIQSVLKDPSFHETDRIQLSQVLGNILRHIANQYQESPMTRQELEDQRCEIQKQIRDFPYPLLSGEIKKLEETKSLAERTLKSSEEIVHQLSSQLVEISQETIQNLPADSRLKQITTEIDCIQDEIKKRLDRVRELQNQVARRESISFVETIKKDLLALDREIKYLSARFYPVLDSIRSAVLSAKNMNEALQSQDTKKIKKNLDVHAEGLLKRLDAICTSEKEFNSRESKKTLADNEAEITWILDNMSVLYKGLNPAKEFDDSDFRKNVAQYIEKRKEELESLGVNNEAEIFRLRVEIVKYLESVDIAVPMHAITQKQAFKLRENIDEILSDLTVENIRKAYSDFSEEEDVLNEKMDALNSLARETGIRADCDLAPLFAFISFMQSTEIKPDQMGAEIAKVRRALLVFQASLPFPDPMITSFQKVKDLLSKSPIPVLKIEEILRDEIMKPLVEKEVELIGSVKAEEFDEFLRPIEALIKDIRTYIQPPKERFASRPSVRPLLQKIDDFLASRK